METQNNRYLLQQQNSVTKKWMTILETNYTEAEVNFQNLVNNPENVKYGHKYRVLETSRIMSN